ncbi:MAG: hypothetical protein UT48_C0001G0089 [Parcubacteria group bacterium GW2011_GWE2_39_37]|uniref:Uncharacterized protein n=1 Tax=Candidatus Falkowbacteria bacterium GW2011_GWF2_39_8 TaxID=1618642 RepID=A0A0G0T786_9BACT|nr:MAG: hypothetical protein UT48_C0001G0089 [Parcubacteria group bacterium GW2011_GWE2_39_37]KKR33702.1 MAG: hypothetical protein UT64_C0004G0009 [Candidatus Falkowbacteria bacterium GW2011_GWF2_39_8]
MLIKIINVLFIHLILKQVQDDTIYKKTAVGRFFIYLKYFLNLLFYNLNLIFFLRLMFKDIELLEGG